jgi:hypothetical protein
MSEFTGECYHLVHSDGWCEECKKKVHIIFHNDSDLVAEEQEETIRDER